MPPINTLSKTRVAAILGSLLTVNTQAATIEVTSSLDDNGAGCTLREAIVSINNNGQSNNGCLNNSNDAFGTNDSINFANSLATNNTVTLSNGALEVGSYRGPNTAMLTIDASNLADGLTVDAARSDKALYLSYKPLLIRNMTITGGANSSYGGLEVTGESGHLILENCVVTGNSSNGDGGGIALHESSSLTLRNTEVTDNSAQRSSGGLFVSEKSSATLINSTISNNTVLGSGRVGGGIGVSGYSSVELFNSTVFNNMASIGGGISIGSNSTLNLTDSSVSNNLASLLVEGIGGGILARDSMINLKSSIISGNVAQESGGGISASGTTSINLENSTLSGNSARIGGGVSIFTDGSLILTNSTVADNVSRASYSGQIEVSSTGTLALSNSIIASAGNGRDCRNFGALTIDAASIVEDGSCNASRSGDPGLLPLADNGGPTLTHALSANSIARNSSVGACPLNDQRRVRRDLSDGACDVGAYEFEEEDTFFVVPLNNGKAVIFEL